MGVRGRQPKPRNTRLSHYPIIADRASIGETCTADCRESTADLPKNNSYRFSSVAVVYNAYQPGAWNGEAHHGSFLSGGARAGKCFGLREGPRSVPAPAK